VAVLRALWTGGPVTRPSPFYPLEDAYSRPIPDPAPRVLVGGETAAGARLAGRIGDGWSTFDNNFEANLPLYLEALEAGGKSRADQLVLVGFQGDDWLDHGRLSGTGWIEDPRATWERWHEAGADGAIVTAKSDSDIDALVDAVERW
jgi:Luciferase-like monooxygenase